MICGDRPVLRIMNDGIIVYPSPWNGKEGWHGAEAAPLEGIICLERGEDNRVEPLKNREAVILVYNAIIQTAITEENVLRTAELETQILKNYRVYRLISRDVPQSSELLFDRLFR